MKTVIIGGSGFVGKNVKQILSKQLGDENVHSVSRNNDFDLLDLKPRNYRDENLLCADFVINCAANVGSLNYVTEKPAEIIDSNSRMILNLYDFLFRINSNAVVINPIANCAFPGNLTLYSEKDFWDGEIHKSVLSYGMTKRFLTVVSECYYSQYGIKSINYYVPNMYGEYDSINPNKAHALNALISKLVDAKKKKKKKIVVWGTGKPVREWLYAKDFGRIVSETIYRINNGEYFSESINIGQNMGVSINELLNIVIPIIGYKGEIVYNIDKQDGAMKKVMDNKKFVERFPDFHFTNFTEGIKNTVKYYWAINFDGELNDTRL